MFRFLIIFIIVSLCACSTHTQKKFDSSIEAGQCEKALENLPENQTSVKFLRKTQEATGTTFSYAATGAGYTTDVIINVVGGAIIFAVVCSPLLLTAVLASGANGSHVSGNSGSLCFPSEGLKDMKTSNLGQTTYKKTTKWRCPNLKPLSEATQKLASCYANRKNKENIQIAIQSLESIRDTEQFYLCLPKKEQEKIHKSIERYKQDLAI